jgi:hypothetical protein
VSVVLGAYGVGVDDRVVGDVERGCGIGGGEVM